MPVGHGVKEVDYLRRITRWRRGAPWDMREVAGEVGAAGAGVTANEQGAMMHCKQAMIVYAIRHAPTGSGWSWWEPTETRPGYLPHDAHPRLFFTRASAVNALGQWLRGPLQKREVGRGYMSWGEEDSRTKVGAAEHDPLDLYPPRRREDMVLVPFTLTEA